MHCNRTDLAKLNLLSLLVGTVVDLRWLLVRGSSSTLVSGIPAYRAGLY